MASPSAFVLNGTVGTLGGRGALAAAGKYFVFTNPTPGTAIAYALKTGFSATANGLFCISNGNPANSGINIYPDFFELTQTATAPTGALTMRFESYLEQGIVAMTTAVATRTPVNPNSGSAATSSATCQSFDTGAATVPAAVGSRRLAGIGVLPTSDAVANSTYGVVFGGVANVGPTSNGPGLTAAAATAPNRLFTAMPAVVIAPQTTLIVNMWWITQAANTPSFEFTFGYAEA